MPLRETLNMQLRRAALTNVLLVVTSVVFPTPTNAAESRAKLDRAVLRALQHRTGNLRVIVRAKPDSDRELRRQFEGHGGRIHRRHDFIEAFTAEVTRAEMLALADDPLVDSISIDAVVAAHQKVQSTSAIDVLRTTLGLTGGSPTGSGVGVALIDSGAFPSSDFQNDLIAFYDFTRDGRAT